MKIETIKPYKTSNLEINDIIFGEPEFKNGYRYLSNDKIIVGFETEEECDKYDESLDTMFSKGKVFQFPKHISLKRIDETREKSIWG